MSVGLGIFFPGMGYLFGCGSFPVGFGCGHASVGTGGTPEFSRGAPALQRSSDICQVMS